MNTLATGDYLEFVRFLQGKTVHDLDVLSATYLCEDIRCWGGPHEENPVHNAISSQIIRAMKAEHGDVYLWHVNPGRGQRIGYRPVIPPDPDITFGFDASFATPGYDAELEGLIRSRVEAEYTGAASDRVHVEAIFSRAEAIGGISLIWS